VSATLPASALDRAPATIVIKPTSLPIPPRQDELWAHHEQAEFRLAPSRFYGTEVVPRDDHPSAVLVRQRWRSRDSVRATAAAT